MEKNVLCITVPVSRGSGASICAGAAYRAAENIKGIGLGEDGKDKWFSYANRNSVVRETFLMTPEGELPSYLSFDHEPDKNDTKTARAQLWNEVEAREKGDNARLGRELRLGFAYELSHDEQRELVKQFVREHITHGGTAITRIHGKPVEVEMSFVADVSIHNYGRAIPAIGATDEQRDKLRLCSERGYIMLERDEADGAEQPHIRIDRDKEDNVTGYRIYNPHAHVLISPRPVVDGEWAKNKHASRVLNAPETTKDWRYEFPKLQNSFLERKGSDVRVTCTSETEDQFPDIRFLGTGRDNQAHNRAERAEAMPEEARAKHKAAEQHLAKAQEFNEVHNAALAQAAHSAPQDSTEEADRETVRTTTWWRNMSLRFDAWRHDFAEKAQEWKERFAAQEARLKSVLGWHVQMDEPDPPEPIWEHEHTPAHEESEPDR